MLDASQRPTYASSFSPCLVSSRSPRPRTKLVRTFCWCLLTLLLSGWLGGSFSAPGEEGAEKKGQMCGFVPIGEVWKLFQRHRSDLFWNLVHQGH